MWGWPSTCKPSPLSFLGVCLDGGTVNWCSKSSNFPVSSSNDGRLAGSICQEKLIKKFCMVHFSNLASQWICHLNHIFTMYLAKVSNIITPQLCHFYLYYAFGNNKLNCYIYTIRCIIYIVCIETAYKNKQLMQTFHACLVQHVPQINYPMCY